MTFSLPALKPRWSLLLWPGLYLIFKGLLAFADPAQVKFLTATSAQILAFCSGSHFLEATPGAFFFPELNIWIDASCSGANLLLITMLSLGLISSFYYIKVSETMASIPVILALAYLSSVSINSARIVILLQFQEPLHLLSGISSPTLHEAIGVIINLFFLILTCLLSATALNHYHAKPA